MTRASFGQLVLWSLAAAAIIWVALAMQSRTTGVNEACYGPLTDEFIANMYRVRGGTFAVSLLVSVPLVWMILRGLDDRRAWFWIGGAFLVWKLMSAISNAWASPQCWEPYENDAPFWNEGFAGPTWLLQPLAFMVFSALLIVVLVVMWGRWVWERVTGARNSCN